MDCKKELKKRLSESYERMVKLWMASTPAQLVAAAEEIAAARFIHDSLTDAVTEGDAAFLLRYEDPLAVLRDKWIEENGAMMVHDDGLAHCIESLSAQQAEEGAPVTVLEFLTSHPGASFNMMTPGGYVSLTPKQAEGLLAGESVSCNPGCPGFDMEVTADELLPQYVGGQRLERGVWLLGTYIPELEQDMTMQ